MMQKLSVALCFLTVLALLVGCSSTAHTGAADIRLDREASYFDDFTVQDETVLLRCVLQIENDGAEQEVTISLHKRTAAIWKAQIAAVFPACAPCRDWCRQPESNRHGIATGRF